MVFMCGMVGMVILYGMALGYCYGINGVWHAIYVCTVCIVMVQVYQGGINGGHVWHGIHVCTVCWLVGTVAQWLVMVGVYQGGINGGHVKSLPPDGRLHPEWAEDGRSSSSSSSILLVIESGLVNIINNNRTSLD